MSEQCQNQCCRPDDQHMAIHTQKITDSCRDKDCVEDLRVYLTRDSQQALEHASGVKVRTADLIHVAVDVSPMGFHPNHYCIDLVFYYRILADATAGACRPVTLCGLAAFPKRAILCGEVAGTHIFSNDHTDREFCGDRMPRAVVEALDPMVLASRVGCGCGQDGCCPQFPDRVCHYFEEELATGCCEKRLYVTLGQFSVIRLERPAQLLVPVLDYALPTKACCDQAGCTENPCDLFARIPFPAGEFTPTGCDCSCECDRPS